MTFPPSTAGDYWKEIEENVKARVDHYNQVAEHERKIALLFEEVNRLNDLLDSDEIKRIKAKEIPTKETPCK